MVTAAIEPFLVRSVVRGYHAYKDIWMPNHGHIFHVKIEEHSSHDRYTVAITVDTDIAGHVSHEFQKSFTTLSGIAVL